MKIKLFWLLFDLSFLFLSCKTTEESRQENLLNGTPITIKKPTGPKIQPKIHPNIYIAGLENLPIENGGYFVIKHDDQSVRIQDTNNSYYANDMKTFNGFSYIVGYEFYNGRKRACYWLNNEKYVLDNDSEESEATGIIILNNDVYICGQKRILNSDISLDELQHSDIIKNSTYVIVVWKNNIEFTNVNKLRAYTGEYKRCKISPEGR
jgi:hypothetical protein